MAVTHAQTRELFTVTCDDVEIGFSRDDGGLRVLRRRDGPELAGHGEPRPSVDVALGEQGWLAERAFVRYLSHSVEERGGGVEVVVVIGIGPLIVYDRYHITGTLIARRLTVQNVGEDEVQLRGVRLLLPWVAPGLAGGRFEAPGNSVRPRVPIETAAELRPGVLPRRFFAPGLRDGRVLEPAPTLGPGLVALHEPADGESLLCWYHGTAEPALPEVVGNGQALTIGHQVELADWLRPEVAVSADAQYVLLLRGPWREALASYQRTAALVSPPPPDTPPAGWVRDAAIYEVHPAQFGGFLGLAHELPRLAALGISALCLLPIWERAAPADRPWDGTLQSGSPYAVARFDRLDATLGPPDDLRYLVQEAHRHGMRVLADLPLIGVAPSSPSVAEHADWFCQDEHGQPARAAAAELHARGVADGLVRFNWASPALHDHIAACALDLLRAYELDGLRATPPRTVQPHWDRHQAARASAGALGYLSLIERLRRAACEVREDAVVLGALGGPAFARRQDFAVDELPHHMFFHLGLGRMRPSELGDWLTDHWDTLPPNAVRVCFTESYLTRELNPLADGMRGSRISRMLLAGLVLSGFVPMIRAGQEQGDEKFLSRLLSARVRSEALRRGDVRYNDLACDSPHVFSVLRTSGDELVIGLLNTAPHRHAVTLHVPIFRLELPEGDYGIIDLLGGRRWCEDGRETWSHTDLVTLRLTLDPYAAYCLALQPVPPMAAGAPTELASVER